MVAFHKIVMDKPKRICLEIFCSILKICVSSMKFSNAKIEKYATSQIGSFVFRNALFVSYIEDS